MEKITLSKDDLEQLIKDTVKSTLSEVLNNIDDISDLFERLEDRKFGKLIKNGDMGEFVPEAEVMKELRR